MSKSRPQTRDACSVSADHIRAILEKHEPIDLCKQTHETAMPRHAFNSKDTNTVKINGKRKQEKCAIYHTRKAQEDTKVYGEDKVNENSNILDNQKYTQKIHHHIFIIKVRCRNIKDGDAVGGWDCGAVMSLF